MRWLVIGDVWAMYNLIYEIYPVDLFITFVSLTHG